MAIKVLALDLEGTLISNAASQFPRPGLRTFLGFCLRRFARVVVFTAVAKARTLAVVSTLVTEGDAPPEWQSRLEYVDWHGPYKDLRFISGVEPHEVLLIDDQEMYVLPEQRAWWIPIKEWEPPYDPEDQELNRIRREIEVRPGRGWRPTSRRESITK